MLPGLGCCGPSIHSSAAPCCCSDCVVLTENSAPQEISFQHHTSSDSHWTCSDIQWAPACPDPQRHWSSFSLSPLPKLVLHSFHQFAHPLPKLLPHRSPKEMVSLAFPLTWLFPSHPSRFWPASPLQQPPLLPLGYRLHSFLRTPTCGVAFNRLTHVSALTELLEDRACLLIFPFSCLAQYLNLTKHQ